MSPAYVVHAVKRTPTGKLEWFVGLVVGGFNRDGAETIAAAFREQGCTTKIISVEKATRLEREAERRATSQMV